MHLYVVIDTSGAGRIVGVFDSEERANEIASVDPCYYKIHRGELNQISALALHWTRSDEQRERLRQLDKTGTDAPSLSGR